MERGAVEAGRHWRAVKTKFAMIATHVIFSGSSRAGKEQPKNTSVHMYMISSQGRDYKPRTLRRMLTQQKCYIRYVRRQSGVPGGEHSAGADEKTRLIVRQKRLFAPQHLYAEMSCCTLGTSFQKQNPHHLQREVHCDRRDSIVIAAQMTHYPSQLTRKVVKTT